MAANGALTWQAEVVRRGCSRKQCEQCLERVNGKGGHVHFSPEEAALEKTWYPQHTGILKATFFSNGKQPV